MAEYTEKWKKSFGKKYSKAINSLKEFEKEYKEMSESNSDKYLWVSIEDSVFEFDSGDTPNVYHHEKDDELPEYVEISIGTGLVSFAGKFTDLKQLIQLRNDLTEAIDKFERPIEKVKNIITDECEEEDENWENNEYQEYVIQASRSLVESWTHTVQARSSCEAYRLVKEDSDGSTNDENADYDQYGDIEWEII